MNSSEQDNKFGELLRGALGSGPGAGACGRFEAEDAVAYLEKVLTKAEREVYEGHLAECAVCRQQLLELSRLSPVSSAPVNVTAAKVSESWWRWLFSGWRLGLAGGLAATAAAVMIFVVANRNSGQDLVASKNETSAPVVEPTRVITDTPKLGETTKPEEAKRAETQKGQAPRGVTNDQAPGVTAGAIEAKKAAPMVELPPPPAPAMAPIAIDGASAKSSAKSVAEVEGKAKEVSQDAMRDRAEQSVRSNVSSNSARILSGPMQNQANQVQGVQAEEMRTRPAAKAEAARTVSAAKRPEERTVRGKKFALLGGIWVDGEAAGVKGVPLVEVKRGSDEFNKLVSENPELKDIFGLGKVLVVWKGKLYKTLE